MKSHEEPKKHPTKGIECLFGNVWKRQKSKDVQVWDFDYGWEVNNE